MTNSIRTLILLLVQGPFRVENRPENSCRKSKPGSLISSKFSGGRTRKFLFECARRSGMARGRKTSRTIRLTPAERQTLLAWQRSTTISAGLARRGRILLLRGDGMTLTAIAATVGLSRCNTYKWIQRFLQDGLAGREDTLGRGRHGLLQPPHAQLDVDVG